MNVCNDGGSIVVIGDFKGAANEPVWDMSKGPAATQISYCRQREKAERAAAKRSPSVVARRVHQELAEAYAQLARKAAKP